MAFVAKVWPEVWFIRIWFVAKKRVPDGDCHRAIFLAAPAVKLALHAPAACVFSTTLERGSAI